VNETAQDKENYHAVTRRHSHHAILF